MYKRLLIFSFVVIGLTVLLGFLPVHGETQIYDSVLRLHVLANSDSEEDQALKLKVRDAVLKHTENILKDCNSKEQAQAILRSALPDIEAIAERVISAEGYGYSVSAVLDEEDYPTRNYESCCFPAGEYTSLRIMLGEAEGQNWWCVLFPPLCLSAASDNDEAFIQAGLTDGQYKIITESGSAKYKARFKLLETIESAVGKK